MGSVPSALARELKSKLGLQRAVETGTYLGGGARRLADVFDVVLTIELSHDLYRAAAESLKDVPAIQLIQGDSRTALRSVSAEAIPTLYWLDGHWSGGDTAGVEDECPILDELDAIAAGHPDDCVLIDDARLFTAAPPPPHKPDQWPTLLELIDRLRSYRPEHHITVLDDIVFAVPRRAKESIDKFGQRVTSSDSPRPRRRIKTRLVKIFRRFR